MFWIKNLVHNEQHLIQFVYNSDSIILYIPNNDVDNKLMRFVIRNDENSIYKTFDGNVMHEKWAHFAVTFSPNGNIGRFYFIKLLEEELLTINGVEMTDNYIQGAKTIFDDIKIFARILTSDEVRNEMNNKPYNIIQT